MASKGRPIGGIGFSFQRTKPFAGEEKAFMIAAAYHCAQALERARLYAAEQTARAIAEAAEARINSILESISDGFVSLDNDLRYTYVNQRAEQILRNTRREMLGRTVSETFPGFVRSPLYVQVKRALTERVTTEYELFSQNLEVWLLVRIYPFEGGLSLYFQDVTESRKVQTNQQLLAEISTALASSIDYEETLDLAATLIIPRLADRCLIDLVEADGRIQTAKIAHFDPARVELVTIHATRMHRVVHPL